MTLNETRKRYTDAAKLDLIDLLTKDNPDVFEFRRIAQIAEIMIPLLNSVDTAFSHKSIADAMWEAEDRAPNLHKALGGHIFDGDELLQEKYRYMMDAHSALKAKHADLLEKELQIRLAGDSLALQAQRLEVGERALAAEQQLLRLGAPSKDAPALSAANPRQEPLPEEPEGDGTETDPKKPGWKKLLGL